MSTHFCPAAYTNRSVSWRTRQQTDNHTNKRGQSVEQINKGKPTFVQTYSSICNATVYLKSAIKMVETAWDDSEPEWDLPTQHQPATTDNFVILKNLSWQRIFLLIKLYLKLMVLRVKAFTFLLLSAKYISIFTLKRLQFKRFYERFRVMDLQ